MLLGFPEYGAESGGIFTEYAVGLPGEIAVDLSTSCRELFDELAVRIQGLSRLQPARTPAALPEATPHRSAGADGEALCMSGGGSGFLRPPRGPALRVGCLLWLWSCLGPCVLREVRRSLRVSFDG